jgi:hypothetical protein
VRRSLSEDALDEMNRIQTRHRPNEVLINAIVGEVEPRESGHR